MIFDIFLKKPETEEQLVIRWADTLILKTNHKGEIDIMSFYPFDAVLEEPTQDNISKWRNDEARKIRDVIISNLGNINGQLDIITKELTKYLEAVKSHLLTEGYIHDPVPTKTGWLLSDIGKQVKVFGGHEKYKRFKKRELLATKKDQNAKIYWWWRKILEWLIAATLGFLLRVVAEPKQNQTQGKQSPQPHQRTSISSKPTGKGKSSNVYNDTIQGKKEVLNPGITNNDSILLH